MINRFALSQLEKGYGESLHLLFPATALLEINGANSSPSILPGLRARTEILRYAVFLLGFVHLIIFCVDAWGSFGVSSGHRLLVGEGTWKAALGVFALDVCGRRSAVMDSLVVSFAPSPTLNDSLFFFPF